MKFSEKQYEHIFVSTVCMLCYIIIINNRLNMFPPHFTVFFFH